MCIWFTTILINNNVLYFPSNFWIKPDVKMAKMEQNNMANFNMNVLRIVWLNFNLIPLLYWY